MSCAKTAEPIEMPFGLLSRVGQRNRVLDGVHIQGRDQELFLGCFGVEGARHEGPMWGGVLVEGLGV